MSNNTPFVDLLKGRIISQLKTIFGNIPVYDEKVRQGLKVPAFLLSFFEINSERRMKGQTRKTYHVNLNYFPRENAVKTECDRTLEMLQDNFRYIGGKHHVHNFAGEVVDDVLVTTFKVVVLFADVEDEVKMQILGGVGIDTTNAN